MYDEELPVSEDYFIQSFQFHYWYITDEDGNCIGIYHAGNLLETNVITFQDK